jgi:hypothetical protein
MKRTRALLIAVGYPLSLVGALEALRLLPQVLQNDSGCIFYPCTTPATRALFVLALGGFVAGLVLLGLAATDVKTPVRFTALGLLLSVFGAGASLLLLRGILLLGFRGGQLCFGCEHDMTVAVSVLALGVLIAGLVMLGLAAPKLRSR